jgi:invasion protein IalB
MKTLPTNTLVARLLVMLALATGALHAAAAESAPLSRADIGKLDTVLTKLLKGKPAVQSGTKQEVEGGWRFNCLATVGSGGLYELVVLTEKTMTLGYIESQKPAPESGTAKKDAAKKS